MTYLIDSDRVADYLKGRPDAQTLLRTLAPSGLAISIVTYAEILEGIWYGSDPARNRRNFHRFLRFVDILERDINIFERFAVVRGQLRRTGQTIGDFDILIGATALEHDLKLVTRNVSHFSRIPNLAIHELGNSESR